MKADTNPHLQDSYIDSVPTRNVRSEGGGECLVTLLKPNPLTGIIGRWLQSKLPKRYFRIKLDSVGSNVWDLVDGVRTIKEISDLLAEQMGEKIEPRYNRVSQFIRSLHDGDMVNLIRKNQEQS